MRVGVANLPIHDQNCQIQNKIDPAHRAKGVIRSGRYEYESRMVHARITHGLACSVVVAGSRILSVIGRRALYGISAKGVINEAVGLTTSIVRVRGDGRMIVVREVVYVIIIVGRNGVFRVVDSSGMTLGEARKRACAL